MGRKTFPEIPARLKQPPPRSTRILVNLFLRTGRLTGRVLTLSLSPCRVRPRWTNTARSRSLRPTFYYPSPSWLRAKLMSLMCRDDEMISNETRRANRGF